MGRRLRIREVFADALAAAVSPRTHVAANSRHIGDWSVSLDKPQGTGSPVGGHDLAGPNHDQFHVPGPKKCLNLATRRGQHSGEIIDVDDFPVSRRKVFRRQHTWTLASFTRLCQGTRYFQPFPATAPHFTVFRRRLSTAATFAYDPAKRPTGITKGSLTFNQAYDRDGNVTSESRSLPSVAPLDAIREDDEKTSLAYHRLTRTTGSGPSERRHHEPRSQARRAARS